MRRRLLHAFAVLPLAALLAACSSGGSAGAPSPSAAASHSASGSGGGSTSPSPATSSAAPPPSTPAAATGVALLTGVAGADGPVVVIKEDNHASAWPLQRGLSSASVVYEELVEGGITRYALVFVGPQNLDVGPCRSGRATDIMLLGEYGHVVVGFSGAAANVLQRFSAADLAPRPQELYPQLYDIRGRRPIAYNEFTSPARLLSVGTAGVATVRDVGFRFGPLPAGAGTPVHTVTAQVNPSYRVSYTWTGAGWQISRNGVPMHPADAVPNPKTVILQQVQIGQDTSADEAGTPSPLDITVGSGKAWILRDGVMVAGTWTRPTAGSPTHFLDASGADIPLAPGQVWVGFLPAPGTPTAS